MAIELTVVKAQTLNAGGKPDVAFMENRSPLHGRAMQYLARAAMTDLGIDRVGADFVPHRPAIAPGAILGDEALVAR